MVHHPLLFSFFFFLLIIPSSSTYAHGRSFLQQQDTIWSTVLWTYQKTEAEGKAATNQVFFSQRLSLDDQKVLTNKNQISVPISAMIMAAAPPSDTFFATLCRWSGD